MNIEVREIREIQREEACRADDQIATEQYREGGRENREKRCQPLSMIPSVFWHLEPVSELRNNSRFYYVGTLAPC